MVEYLNEAELYSFVFWCWCQFLEKGTLWTKWISKMVDVAAVAFFGWY